MEGYLLFPWNKYATLFPNEDQEIRQVSDKDTKHVQEMVNALKAEFPAAAVSLKVCLRPSPLENQVKSFVWRYICSVMIYSYIHHCLISSVSLRRLS